MVTEKIFNVIVYLSVLCAVSWVATQLLSRFPACPGGQVRGLFFFVSMEVLLCGFVNCCSICTKRNYPVLHGKMSFVLLVPIAV